MLAVDVISDFVCPWCWIGKRNLDSFALETPVERRWHPYMLSPDMPAGGIDRAEYVKTKFGSAEYAEELASGVIAAGKAAGVGIDYSKIKRVPSTRDAHRLVRWAGGTGRADSVAEALFRSYFTEGCDIGDADVLADIGAGAGMDRAVIADLLAGDADANIVRLEAERARQAGINGVPTYIFGNAVAVVGAQPVEAMRAAAAKVQG